MFLCKRHPLDFGTQFVIVKCICMLWFLVTRERHIIVPMRWLVFITNQVIVMFWLWFGQIMTTAFIPLSFLCQCCDFIALGLLWTKLCTGGLIHYLIPLIFVLIIVILRNKTHIYKLPHMESDIAHIKCALAIQMW